MKALGANWKTTVSGIGAAVFAFLTIVAAVPYELGDLALIIAPEWKAKITLWSGIAALILRCWNAYLQKDKAVTGGTVQQDAEGKIAKPQEPIPEPPLPATPEPPEPPKKKPRVKRIT